MKTCIACGMPMQEASDFAMHDPGRDYCIHCARADGSMQSFEEKLAEMTDFIVKTQGFDKSAAAGLARNRMRRLPAWKDCFAQG